MNDRLYATAPRTERHDSDLEGVLRDFFRRQMPDPWPPPPEVEPKGILRAQEHRRPPWHRRLALAAAVGLFLLSYLALSQFTLLLPGFNPQQVQPGHLGKQLDGPKAQPDRGPAGEKVMPVKTRSGSYMLFERRGPGNSLQLRFEPAGTPAPGKQP